MIDALKRTVVGAKDLSEQPPAPYILITGGGPGRVYYYVDDWSFKGPTVEFTNKHKVVYVCRAQEGVWAIISTDLSDLMTNEELFRLGHREAATVEALQKELTPATPGEEDTGYHGVPEDYRPGNYA